MNGNYCSYFLLDRGLVVAAVVVAVAYYVDTELFGFDYRAHFLTPLDPPRYHDRTYHRYP